VGNTAERSWTEVEPRLSTVSVLEWVHQALGEDIDKWVVGIAAVLGFLRERPLMAVADVEEGSDFMLGLMWKEVNEVREAKTEEMPLEYADVMVFAILTGALFWQQLNTRQREQVLIGISMGAHGLARLDGAAGHSPVDELIRVARKKDPDNYSADKLQLLPGETVEEARERFRTVNLEFRELREAKVAYAA